VPVPVPVRVRVPVRAPVRARVRVRVRDLSFRSCRSYSASRSIYLRIPES